MNLKAFLGLSLALNAVALGALILMANRPARTPADGDSSPLSEPGVVVQRPETPKSATPDPAAPAKPSGPTDWTAALRAAGVPEKLIADVAAANFESRWQKRMQEIQKKFDRGEIDEDVMARFFLERDVEQEKEMRGALGDEGFRHWDQDRVLAEFDRADLKLTGVEADELYQLKKNLEKQGRAVEEARQQGKMDEIDVEGKIEAMHSQYNEQLKKLLGDDRHASMQTAGDGTAGEMRRSLRAISADETLVETMLASQKQWNDQRSKLEQQLQSGQVTAEEYEKQMKSLDSTRDQDYQKTLGADGYAEFQKAQDHRYRTMKRFGDAWGLDDNDINHLYSAIKTYEANVRDYQEQARAIEEQGQVVDWPAVEKALKDFSRQTEQTLITTLGPERFSKLRRNNVVTFEQ